MFINRLIIQYIYIFTVCKNTVYIVDSLILINSNNLTIINLVFLEIYALSTEPITSLIDLITSFY